MSHRVQGKVALVTGAAGGLGRAIVAELLNEGATVWATDLQESSLAESFQGLASPHAASLRTHVLDVCSPDGWAQAMKAIMERDGRVDVLVNNAAVLTPGHIESTTLEQWQRMMMVNAQSVFLGCQAAVVAMKANGGSIINVSSLASWMPVPDYTAYGASKAAVAALTKTTALHCRRRGYRIRVNSVHPDGIATPMMAGTLPPGIKPEHLMWDAQRNPKGRAYPPESIARSVLFLASDESAVISGAELHLDNAILGMGL